MKFWPGLTTKKHLTTTLLPENKFSQPFSLNSKNSRFIHNHPKITNTCIPTQFYPRNPLETSNFTKSHSLFMPCFGRKLGFQNNNSQIHNLTIKLGSYASQTSYNHLYMIKAWWNPKNHKWMKNRAATQVPKFPTNQHNM